MPRIACIALLMILGSAGCAKYEYRIAQPADLSRHIGSKTDEVVAIDPIEYRMRTVSNRLVIRIFNATNDPIMLDGERSFAVDPKQQSHPLRSQTIAPNSFAKLILPPLRPRIQNSGPTFGVGVGVGVGRAHRRRHYSQADEIIYDEPRYFDIYDDNDVQYWDWSGETDVRLLLTFHRGEQTFQHDFTFHRVKM